MFLHNQVGYDASYAPSRFTARLDTDLCLGAGCGLCKDRCSFRAINVNGEVSIDQEKCYGCGNCAHICPVQAIALEEARPIEFIRRT
jgi:ferredoxin